MNDACSVRAPSPRRTATAWAAHVLPSVPQRPRPSGHARRMATASLFPAGNDPTGRLRGWSTDAIDRRMHHHGRHLRAAARRGRRQGRLRCHSLRSSPKPTPFGRHHQPRSRPVQPLRTRPLSGTGILKASPRQPFRLPDSQGKGAKKKNGFFEQQFSQSLIFATVHRLCPFNTLFICSHSFKPRKWPTRPRQPPPNSSSKK